MNTISTSAEQASAQAPAEDPKLKAFRVTFYKQQTYGMDVLAATEADAIAKVTRHWFRISLIPDAEIIDPLSLYDADDFEDPRAEEVQS